jgi:hypothetical protein
LVSSLASNEERDNIRAMEVEREPNERGGETRPGVRPSGRADRGWYFFCMGFIALCAGGLVWFQVTQTQSRRPTTRMDELSERFHGPAEKARELLRAAGVHMLFAKAVARGDVPWNSQSEPIAARMPNENEYTLVNVDNRDVKPIAEWFRKKIAPGIGGLRLNVVVESPGMGDKPASISRVFTITAAKVQEIISAKEGELQRKMYEAIDAGELRVNGYPTITEEFEKEYSVAAQDVAEADVYTLADWIRRQLPGAVVPAELTVRGEGTRKFELLRDGVRETTLR